MEVLPGLWMVEGLGPAYLYDRERDRFTLLDTGIRGHAELIERTAAEPVASSATHTASGLDPAASSQRKPRPTQKRPYGRRSAGPSSTPVLAS